METKPVIYTPEFVLAEMQDIYQKLASNSNIIYIGEIITNKPYSLQRFSEWRNAFKTDDEISETIQKIKGILETRAVVGGLKGTLNSSMTKFHLINNFDWTEKSEVDHTTGGEKISLIPPEVALKLAALYEEEMKDKLT